MPNVNSSITLLEASYAKPIGASFNIDNQPDVIAQLLADKRAPNTRRAYMKDITDFFRVVANTDKPSRDLVLECSPPGTNPSRSIGTQLQSQVNL